MRSGEYIGIRKINKTNLFGVISDFSFLDDVPELVLAFFFSLLQWKHMKQITNKQTNPVRFLADNM